MRITRRLAGPAAIASLAVVGCGETVIDAGKVEKLITKAVIDQTGVRVTSVACPEGRALKKGDTFTCTVLAKDGTKGQAVVVQRDDEGSVKTTAPFLHIRNAERAIADQIKEQAGATVTVTCPEIVVAKTGRKFRCQATDGTRTRQVETTMTDDTGNIRFKVL
jgi:hypothetical protein